MTDTIPTDYRAHITEDSLVSGLDLRPGMIVTFEDSHMRTSPADGWKQWATLHSAEVVSLGYEIPTVGMTPAQVRVIGEFPDGELRSWTGAITHMWIVKKASIPTTTPEA